MSEKLFFEALPVFIPKVQLYRLLPKSLKIAGLTSLPIVGIALIQFYLAYVDLVNGIITGQQKIAYQNFQDSTSLLMLALGFFTEIPAGPLMEHLHWTRYVQGIVALTVALIAFFTALLSAAFYWRQKKLYEKAATQNLCYRIYADRIELPEKGVVKTVPITGIRDIALEANWLEARQNLGHLILTGYADTENGFVEIRLMDIQNPAQAYRELQALLQGAP